MFLSRVTVTTVGLASKAFLRSPLCAVTVNGLDTLCNALDNDKPVITGAQTLSKWTVVEECSVKSYIHVRRLQNVCTQFNNVHSLDDPVTWGVLPARYYLSARTTRWALGASDVIFTNPCVPSRQQE